MANVNCLRCRFRHEDNGNCTAVGGFCTAVPAAHCPLLRQYLDTGMMPEAFQSYVVFLQDLIGDQKASEALDRFRQLVKADKDGRTVVLPCKVGDVVYGFHGSRTILPMVVKWVETNTTGWDVAAQYVSMTPKFYQFSDFGKTVFLTREEAEKALEAMKDG